MMRLVSIKFRVAGKHYDFNPQGLELAAGDRVIVETDRGRALGTVVQPPREVQPGEVPDGLKNVLRLATDEDHALAAANTARENEAFRFCQQRIGERKMEMKLIRAEYLFDGSKIIFYFTADGRVDFRELVKDLAHHFHSRIEMRQIGVRDEAKLTGGIGICGRELCCCTFLTDFAPVSVKMAKEQGLALNPTKISGQCGRLLCCLGYEFETYCALKQGLPKSGRKVTIDGNEAEIIDVHVLTQKVTVRLETGRHLVLPADQIKTLEGELTASTSQPSISSAQETRTGEKSGRAASGSPRQGERRARPQKRSSAQSRPQPSPTKPPAPPQPPDSAPVSEGGDSTAPEGKKKNRGRRRPRRK